MGVVGDRLDSGMKPDEAVRLASAWWDRVGRQAFRTRAGSAFNGDQAAPRVSPGVIVKGEKTRTLRSGVLDGLHWDLLTRPEKLSVVKSWHHNHIVVPQMEELERQLIGGVQ